MMWDLQIQQHRLVVFFKREPKELIHALDLTA